MKLRPKILALIVPLILVPLGIMAWSAYGELRATAEQKTFKQMDTLLAHQASRMDALLRSATSNLELFSSFSLVKKYVLTADEEDRYVLMLKPLLRLFASYQDTYPEYYEIRILLPDGYEDIRWSSTNAANVTEDESQNPFFLAMARSESPIYHALMQNPDNGEVSLIVGKRLLLHDPSVDPLAAAPKLRAYLVLTVSLDALRQGIRDERIGANGRLFATDASGRVLFQPDPALPVDQIRDELFSTLKKATATEGGLTRAKLNGGDAVFKGQRLYRDLYLFCTLPERQLLTASHRLRNSMAGTMVVTIILTLMLLFFALDFFVVRPIKSLSRAARQIGTGQLAVKINASANDEVGVLAKSLKEMSESLQQSNDQIEYLAYHDGLTGLPNRRMFLQNLNNSLAYAQRNEEQLAVLFLDVDDFKRVNDSLGHQIGDKLLKELASRLGDSMRGEDFMGRAGCPEGANALARLGGDEFVILLAGLKDKFAPSVVANRIIELLKQPFALDGHELYVSGSIGITVYPADGTCTEDLIKCSDLAMYHAKEQGKNNFQYYSDEMNKASIERLNLENRLRQAIQNGHLELYYQPQVDPFSGQIAGAEALLRWNDPQYGIIGPDKFIELAEETGLILPIGEWVIAEACRQNREWQDAGLPEITVSVNVSSIQVDRQDLYFLIDRALRNSRLDGRFLEIEITETTLMSSQKRAAATLKRIGSLDVRVSLDDFGTGYSSMSYLREFPIDNLKIDRSFTKQIMTHKNSTAIITAIIAMAHALDLRVIAEGIEDEAQLNFLRERRCDLIQGFIYGRPLPADQFQELLAQRCLRVA